MRDGERGKRPDASGSFYQELEGNQTYLEGGMSVGL